ncbi:MAG: HAD family phosphatase [Candidatus Aenigmarchaeota archaeon]|nr:HAD family phosphatase [Candidatus Aenigmarchaeota archaeon]
MYSKVEHIVHGVIFDLDGTIADTEPLHYRAWKETLREYRVDFTLDNFVRVVGKGGEKTAEYILQTFGRLDSNDALVRKKRERYMKLLAGVRPAKGAQQLIAGLRGKAKLGLATNSVRPSVLMTLKFLKLGSAFDALATGDEVREIKPAPDVYLLVLKKLGLKAASCIAVEDSLAGFQAAQAAGLRCIVAPNKYMKGQEFPKALMVVESLASLKAEQLLAL